MSQGSTRAAASEAARVKTVFDDQDSAGARSYAEALIGAARKDGQVDPVVDELQEFVDDIFGAQPRFAEMLASPTLNVEQKDRLLTQITEGRAHPTVARFLRVVNHHGRLALLPTIAREAVALRDKMQNRRNVHVRSAEPLTEAQQAELRSRVVALTGADPVIHVQVEPSLIGGLIIQVGDEVYDLSVRSRLEQMRRQIVEDKVHEIRGRLSQAVSA